MVSKTNLGSKKILFVCVANSARSQMAEALAKDILSENYEIRSAGSHPSGHIHEVARKVLAEVGLDMAGQASKDIEDLPQDFMNNLDFMVTLCAEEVCPVIPTKAQRLSWALPDPAAVAEPEQLDAFRNIRDRIKEKLGNSSLFTSHAAKKFEN